ncbi:F-box only protein 32-like isoform X2 [Antedon mediterranea]|uniref:F-box only protein 32-like isoform X2 n=1 Tax=Antedon mediterranea TaxID=105859 RepID=UPI003AF8F485
MPLVAKESRCSSSSVPPPPAVSNSNWVRSGSGWEKFIALRENLNRHIKRLARDRLSNINNRNQEVESSQDQNKENESNRKKKSIDHHSCYIFLPRGGAKKTGFYFTIGEVLNRLDFSGAVHDHRRFNYVCRILEIITESWLFALSGLAQKNFFFILEESVTVVSETKLYVNRVKKILQDISKNLLKNPHFHVGSPKTWNKWLDLVKDWLQQLNTIDYTPTEIRVDSLQLMDLPPDCLNRIMSSLANAKDIVNFGLTCKYIHEISEYTLRWEKLCRFHFTQQQITSISPKFLDSDNKVNWKGVYSRLCHRHGNRELYNNVLNLCNHCNCIYWTDGGHPCSAEITPEFSTRQFSDVVVTQQNLTPEEFMKLWPTP